MCPKMILVHYFESIINTSKYHYLNFLKIHLKNALIYKMGGPGLKCTIEITSWNTFIINCM